MYTFKLLGRVKYPNDKSVATVITIRNSASITDAVKRARKKVLNKPHVTDFEYISNRMERRLN